jgi:hypothetical protein
MHLISVHPISSNIPQKNNTTNIHKSTYDKHKRSTSRHIEVKNIKVKVRKKHIESNKRKLAAKEPQ